MGLSLPFLPLVIKAPGKDLSGTVLVQLSLGSIISFRIFLHCSPVGCKVPGNYKNLGNSVTVARLTLDQLVEVRILVPQILLC
jgi:hypothetical protein